MQYNPLLVLILTALFCVTIVWSLYPLRHSKRLCGLIFLLLLVATPLGYKISGGWKEWHLFQQKEAERKKAQRFLKAVNGQKGVIETLKQKLKDDPKSSEGWYLLGRLYASQGEWTLASRAFKHAYDLKPNDALMVINYAQSLWQVEGKQARSRIQPLLQSILEKNPMHPDAMALFAQCAFEDGDYSLAIEHWQRLLDLVDNNSEEAGLIRRAIAKAHQKSSLLH